uniref:Uncharacterized protein n=1 Tax=Anguilla anguilla TaxID=7936 RepID=A0A0E9UG15_ANGAN
MKSWPRLCNYTFTSGPRYLNEVRQLFGARPLYL